MKKRLFSLFCLLGTVAGLFAGDTAYLFSYFCLLYTSDAADEL